LDCIAGEGGLARDLSFPLGIDFADSGHRAYSQFQTADYNLGANLVN
jgi:hypothetical protein